MFSIQNIFTECLRLKDLFLDTLLSDYSFERINIAE
jgi:hypothetical protein